MPIHFKSKREGVFLPGMPYLQQDDSTLPLALDAAAQAQGSSTNNKGKMPAKTPPTPPWQPKPIAAEAAEEVKAKARAAAADDPVQITGTNAPPNAVATCAILAEACADMEGGLWLPLHHQLPLPADTAQATRLLESSDVGRMFSVFVMLDNAPHHVGYEERLFRSVMVRSSRALSRQVVEASHVQALVRYLLQYQS